MAGVRAENRRLREQVADLEAAAATVTDVATTNGHGAGAGFRTVRSVIAGPSGGTWLWSTTVERTEAMAVPTLAFIRNQLAGGVSSMALQRSRQNADGSTTVVDPGWCADPDPAASIPPSVFWSWVIDDLFFKGVSTLIVMARDYNGFPTALRRALPGQLTYDPIMLAWGFKPLTEVSYAGTAIDPADVVVISGPHDGLINYGAATIRAALDLEAAAMTGAAEPLPNIELHQTSGEPLAPDKAGELVGDWKSARALGATAYTPANIETKTLGWSAADMQMVEARQYMATQLARLAGVNPTLVSAAMGSASSYVYTNQGDYRQAFLDDVLDTYLRAIEGRLSANDVTPRGQLVTFDRDSFTRLTLLERAQILVGAMRSGATPEQVAQLTDAIGLDVAPQDTPASPEGAPAP
jgi:hypothetical protein